MTTPAKVILGIIIVLLIALGAYYFSQNGAPIGEMNGNPSDTSQTGASATNSNDASDAALVKDSAAIDAQLNGLSSDSAAVDAGLNDSPIAQ